MKREITYIKGNKYSLLIRILLCIVLVWTPIFLMFPHVEPINIKACVLFGCLYSITVLLAQGKLGKIYIALSMLMIECVNICELGWVTMNGSVLFGDSLWVVFDTNTEETKGFFQLIPSATYWVVGSQAICSILFTIIATWITKPKNRTIRIVNIIFILIMLGSFATPLIRRKCPYVNFYHSYQQYIQDKIDVYRFFKNRKGLKIEATDYHAEINKTIVVVIGESANRHHYGLYGYPRNTSPHLDSIANELLIYTDVTSPARATLQCMREIVSFANYEAPDLYKKEASLIEVLRGAGYKTYWIDNQGADGHEDNVPSSYRMIASMSDYYHVIPTQTYDEAIFPFYDECLNDTVSNKAIFIHLIGSHFPYDQFVLDEYKIFKDTVGMISPFKNTLDKDNIETINTYDNTIAYNDFVVSTFIRKLRDKQGACALLFISDHGEEMCETYQWCGRSKEKLSRSQCEIPFVLWRNQAYEDAIPLDIDTARSFCTDDVIHAIMDMAGVSYIQKDTTKSIFSGMFEPKVRKVEGTIYDDMPTWR